MDTNIDPNARCAACNIRPMNRQPDTGGFCDECLEIEAAHEAAMYASECQE